MTLKLNGLVLQCRNASKMQLEWQIVQVMIRLLLREHSDLGLHCLRRLVCRNTHFMNDNYIHANTP